MARKKVTRRSLFGELQEAVKEWIAIDNSNQFAYGIKYKADKSTVITGNTIK